MRHSILDKHYTPRVLYHTRSSDFVMGGDTVWSAPAFRASIVAGLFLVLLCSFSTPAIADTATTTSEATWVRGEDGMWMLESSETGGLIVANPIPGVTLHPIADAKGSVGECGDISTMSQIARAKMGQGDVVYDLSLIKNSATTRQDRI